MEPRDLNTKVEQQILGLENCIQLLNRLITGIRRVQYESTARPISKQRKAAIDQMKRLEIWHTKRIVDTKLFHLDHFEIPVPEKGDLTRKLEEETDKNKK